MAPDESSPPNASTGIDWDRVQAALDSEGQEYTDECGNRIKSLFLGSVFSLTPSGKYYTPFAAGNVEPEEAEADQAWFAAVDQEASQHGLSVQSAEGNPSDLLVVKVLETDANPSCERGKVEAAGKRRPRYD